MCGQVVPMLLCVLFAVGSDGARRQADYAKGVVMAVECKHRLRVCNAYPHEDALDVYRGASDKLTGKEPMPYKSCRDFAITLTAGDKLDFKAGDVIAGTFVISAAPNNKAVMLLVIHRHDSVSTSVSFASHIFSNLMNAQVAAIDTYKGTGNATLWIMDANKSGNTDAQGAAGKSRSQVLRYGSVPAVNAGLYEVILAGHNGEAKGRSEFVALNRVSYVVLRTGVEAQHGPSYPEELVVYPHSDRKAFPSGVTKASVLGAAFALVTAAVSVGQWW